MGGLRRWARVGRVVLLSAAIASPLVSHMALATGQGTGLALGLAAVQAVAVGVVLWGALPGRLRPLAVLMPGVLLLALGAGGVAGASGTVHAMVYGGLLVVFGRSLGAGQTPLVTMFARRLNPGFHAGMEGYTRAVTAAWCGFFAGQLVLSAVLLLLAPAWWRPFVTVLNLPLLAVMAGGEYAVRRRRFAGQPHTGLLATIRGVRAIARPAPAAQAGDASR